MPRKRPKLLDSFAVLALLNDEEGAEAVVELLRAAERDAGRVYIHEINVGEVYHIVGKHRSIDAAERVLEALGALPLEIVSGGFAEVLEAARIKAGYPLSYADAFAVAAGIRLGAEVVTGDPEFRAVEDLVPVRWIRGD